MRSWTIGTAVICGVSAWIFFSIFAGIVTFVITLVILGVDDKLAPQPPPPLKIHASDISGPASSFLTRVGATRVDHPDGGTTFTLPPDTPQPFDDVGDTIYQFIGHRGYLVATPIKTQGGKQRVRLRMSE